MPDMSNIKFVDEGKELAIDGAAADDEGILLVADHIEHGGDGMSHLGALVTEGGVVRQDYIAAFGEWATRKRVPCVATHDDGMAGSQCLEALEVVGDMPKEVVVLADGVVFK